MPGPERKDATVDEDDKPLKIREAADRLGLDYATVRGAIEAGELKAIPFESSFRIRPADLAEYRDRGRPRPPRAKRPPIASEPAPETPEQEAARLFAEQARRWSRGSGGGKAGGR